MAQEQYSDLDRFLHKMVLGSKVIQSTSLELQRLLAPKLPKPDRPVFIVGMARSGTTTLLNLLMETGEFESSRYRDLPLPLFPAFWRKIHKSFKLGQHPVQRAHDDGILVSPDSPEAFEEIYWQNIGNHLSEDGLIESFYYYISSIACASGPGKRYISKNNNNITRMGVLEKICEKTNGVIIIPIRDPLKTAMSSLRMHQRFIAMQEEDPFVLEYMNLLGHREFGKGLQWLQIGSQPFQPNHPTTEVECWLEYWVYLHSAITQVSSSCFQMVDFDAIRSAPLIHLKPMLKSCGVDSRYDQLAAMVTQEPLTKLNSVSLKSPDLLSTALRLKCKLVDGGEVFSLLQREAKV
jgi:hypothetical protein